MNIASHLSKGALADGAVEGEVVQIDLAVEVDGVCAGADRTHTDRFQRERKLGEADEGQELLEMKGQGRLKAAAHAWSGTRASYRNRSLADPDLPHGNE